MICYGMSKSDLPVTRLNEVLGYRRSSLGQVTYRLTKGIVYCRRSGNGGPQTCLPAACGVAQGGAQHGPSSSTQTQDPRKGPSLAGRMTRSFLRHGLIRLAREEAERSRWGTSRGARDASHDDQGRQAGASPRSVLPSSLVQRGQAQPRSTEASGKGCHFGATRPRPGGLRDGGHRGAQDGVITSTFGSRRPTLVRIACTSCPPSKWPLLAPFPLNIWEENQGLYK